MADIEHIQYIAAPASAVYDALTTQEGLAEVWTRELEFEARIGAVNTFRFGDEHPTRMRIMRLVANREMSWACIDSDPEWVGTTVDFGIDAREASTAVTLVHGGWREVTEFYRFCNYNWAIFLLSLKQYCEDGNGLTYQARSF